MHHDQVEHEKFVSTTSRVFGNILVIKVTLTGVMAQWLERLPHNRKVVGSSPGRVIPKTFKMVLAAFSSGVDK